MDYYELLQLPAKGAHLGNGQSISPDRIKQAYRAALLRHHPDKAPSLTRTVSVASITGGFSKGDDVRAKSESSSSGENVSVDEIRRAYVTLSDPELRTAYDREVALRNTARSSKDKATETRLTGGEVVDLDDMNFDDATGDTWTRSCRCGQERGFEVRESQLDAAMTKGEKEVVLGCQGCSLWIRVAFDVA